jgi:hypothetical protein
MTTRFHVLIIIFLILCLSSCKDPVTETPPPVPYDRWHSYNIHNYTMDQVRSCYCTNMGEKMRITVRSDTIALVMRLSDSVVMQYPIPSLYRSIDSMFSIIRTSTNDSLVITYNSEYGYPERLDINPQLHPVDGGILFETSNLQIQ